MTSYTQPNIIQSVSIELPLKLGSVTVLKEIHGFESAVPMPTHSFPVPTQMHTHREFD